MESTARKLAAALFCALFVAAYAINGAYRDLHLNKFKRGNGF